MRGYGTSDKPPRVRDYKLELLAADVANLIAALGRDKADVVGHDWGAEVAWHFAMWHPAKLRRVAILNVPHPQRFAKGIRTLRQLRKSWYIFFFQLPYLPERFVSDRSLRVMFRYTTARRDEYSDEDIAAIQQALRWRTGPINYYRAAARYRSPRWQPIEAPTLVIWGERDRWLGRELAEPDPRWVKNARVERIPEATHWVHADEPERVNRLLLQFFA
jgi:pimeloyl-ACP methyl ester carboxylesterase